jgi:hypothetical protein
VAVPAEPGAAFEVVQAEAAFQFAVVVLDPPPDFGSRTRSRSGKEAAGWSEPSRI